MTYSDEYRQKCLEEKGRECYNCSSTTQIEVHHIDGDRSNNDLKNLIPLCRDCHSFVHRQDATGQAALDLLEDFEPRDGPTLIELDEWILDFLGKHEYATPNLLLAKYRERGKEASRNWIADRVTRLEEHGHIGRVHPDTAERKLVSDPREPEGPTIYDCPDCDWGGDDWEEFQAHLSDVHGFD
jgi:hypothetical protein